MDYIPPTNIRKEGDYTTSDLENFTHLRWALKHVGIESILFDGIATDCCDGTTLIHVGERVNVLLALHKIIINPKVLTSMSKFIGQSISVHWSQAGGLWFLINEVRKC